MYIRHNIAGMHVAKELGQAKKNEQKYRKIVTASRINCSTNDVVGLTISEKMCAQISGLTKTSKNT